MRKTIKFELLFTAALLAGCTTVRATQIADDEYKIFVEKTSSNPERLREKYDEGASRACGGDYQSKSEHVEKHWIEGVVHCTGKQSEDPNASSP